MTEPTGLKIVLEELRRVAAAENLEDVPSSVVIAGIIAVLSEQTATASKIRRLKRPS